MIMHALGIGFPRRTLRSDISFMEIFCEEGMSGELFVVICCQNKPT